MVLTVCDLTVARGGLTVLEGVGFVLAPGRALVLRGPNGVGKTTLLRTVAGLQPAVCGRIESTDALAYAGHADGTKAMLSVGENLTFWASVFGTRGIDAALEAFDLVELRERLAGTLSAGQRRRLGLARMMVSGAGIWVFDEPTVSLDAASVGLFATAVRRHLEDGGAALLATHIDLGLSEAEVLDVTPFRAVRGRVTPEDEAFL